MGDNIDLPTLATLTKYWKNHPPIHILMAQYTGFKPEVETPKTETSQEEQLAQLMATAPSFKFVPPAIKHHGD